MKRSYLKCIQLYAAWLFACIGTTISLVFSEVFGFSPCPLCWAQRICLFPLVWILGVAAFDRHLKIGRYVKGLTLIGAGFALYQLSLFIPRFQASCTKTCTAPLAWDLHVWIPIGSLINFGILFFLLHQSSKK